MALGGIVSKWPPKMKLPPPARTPGRTRKKHSCLGLLNTISKEVYYKFFSPCRVRRLDAAMDCAVRTSRKERRASLPAAPLFSAF